MNYEVTDAEYQNEHNTNKQYLYNAMPLKMKGKAFFEKTSNVMKYPSADDFDDGYELMEVVLDRVDQFRFIRSEHLELYEMIYHMVRRGYKGINPISPKHISYQYAVASGERIKPPMGKTTADTAALLSTSGNGKTTSIEWIMKACFPQVIRHKTNDFDDYQITYIKVDMPHNCARPELIYRLLEQVDIVLEKAGYPETGYAKSVLTQKGKRIPIAEMFETLRTVLTRHHVGLFIIDEVQNLEAAGDQERKFMIQLFDDLCNSLKVPHIKIGTPNTVKIFAERMRHQRRLGEIIELTRITDKDEIEAFNEEFFSGIENSVSVSSLNKVINEFWVQSAGIPSVFMDLFRACMRAVLPRNKVLTPEVVSAIMRKVYPNLIPALKGLREKGFGDSIDLMTVDEIYQTDKHEAFIELEAFMRQQKPRGQAAKRMLERVLDLEANCVFSEEESYVLSSIKNDLLSKSSQQSGSQTLDGELVDEA